MLNVDELLAVYEASHPPEQLSSTAISELDQETGALAGGRVWVVVGRPGEGRTTLLTQWAAEVALRGHVVQLVTPREPASWVASRLISQLGRVSLSAVANHDVERSRLEHGLERLRRLPLEVFPAEEDHGFTPETDPWRRYPLQEGPKPAAVMLDDADLVGGMSATRAAQYAASGMLVVVTMPRHLMVFGEEDDAPLDPAWARVADVVLEVRHRSLPTAADRLRPGEADLLLLKNRWGVPRTVAALFHAHYSRFVDVAARPSSPSSPEGRSRG
jgi:replicative DNA helicase